MKYSIIIPVYNVEKYLEKCLDSILGQTYKNYEIILIDDASKDNSTNIIKKYANKEPEKIKAFFFEENKGQSVARNFGVEKSTGDYIFFIDSDDYIDKSLLEKINNKISINLGLDILRISCRAICDKTKKIEVEERVNKFSNLTGEETFLKFRKERIGLDMPWVYVIRRNYWLKNNFKFNEGKIMEDFGLMPLVLVMASNVSSIDYPFYNHLRRENSTITKNDYKSKVRKAFDVLCHYDYLYASIQKLYKKDKKVKKEFIQYISDKVFGYLRQLKGNDLKKYHQEIKNRHMISRLKVYSLKNLLKIILYRFYMIYYK